MLASLSADIHKVAVISRHPAAISCRARRTYAMCSRVFMDSVGIRLSVDSCFDAGYD